MKAIKILLALSLFSFTIFAQEVKREEKINGIKDVIVSGSVKLNVINSEKESLTFEGKEDIIKEIKVTVKGNHLEVLLPKKTYWSFTDKITINLNLKELEKLEFDGAGDLLIKGFDFKSFLLKIDGSSEALLKDNSFKNLNIEINGSGTVEVSGKTENLIANLDGVGKLSAYNLLAENAEIRLNGTGKVEISVEDKLSATINGVGKIIYKGKPKMEKMTLNGLGSIKNYTE